MTPALTLSFSANAMFAASAVIGHQMRLTQAVFDQTYAAHRAMTAPFLAEVPAKPKPAAKAKAPASNKVAAKPKASPKKAALLQRRNQWPKKPRL